MTKQVVLILSRLFPLYHSKKRERTNFRANLENGIKIHTIRANYDQWKHNLDKVIDGDFICSVREWTGRPYNSKQKEFKTYTGKKIWYSERMRGAVTLGEYIVINMDKYYSAPTSTERHEIGHYKQSLIFGWLYLFIIGIPSIIHCKLHKGGNYGHFYTELLADEVEELKIPMVWLSVVLHLVVIFTILLLV